MRCVIGSTEAGSLSIKDEHGSYEATYPTANIPDVVNAGGHTLRTLAHQILRGRDIDYGVGIMCELERRHVILSALALLASSSGASAQSVPVVRRPRTASIETGDLLWTAEPGAWIPFSSTGGISQREALWRAARDKAVAGMKASPDPADRAAAAALERVTFEMFEAGYVMDGKVEEFRTYAGTGFAVGHVALADLTEQGLFVIEARPGPGTGADVAYAKLANGVVRRPYTEWIQDNDRNLVWHGRLKNRSSAEKAAVAARARGKLGRDYWFWSFDLADDSSFYCSKLIWQATMEALDLALDGERAQKRNFWVSPKRLMRSAAIQMLFSPGPYG